MNERIQRRFADWAAFFSALFLVMANPFGIVDTAEAGARAGLQTLRRWSLQIRQFVGTHVAWPVVTFYACAVALIDGLAYATLKAVPATPETLHHWSRGFVTWAAVIGTVTMAAHAADVLYAKYKHPARMPLVVGAILFHVWLRVMMFAAVAHAIATSTELAMIPAVALVVVVLATGYITALALGWIAEKAIQIVEAGGTAIAAPLAVAPEVAMADVRRFMDLFRNDAWRAAPLKVAVDEATVHGIFLILVSFWPNPAWAAIVGIPVYAGGMFGIIAKLNGSAERVRERREAFIWRLYRWSPFILLAARLVAEIPKVKEFWQSFMGFVSVSLGWSTETLKGNFKNPIPSIEIWLVFLLLVIAAIVAALVWKWSADWSKWGKAALRAPAGAFLLLMLVFGLPNASCGMLKSDGEDEAAEQAEGQKTEQWKETRGSQESKAPPRPAAAPHASTATAPARATNASKPPSQMSDAELQAKLADIAARRKAH